MEIFRVKILQARKRLGIKEIEAPSIEIAEKSIVELLYNLMNNNHDAIKVDAATLVYVVRNDNERFLKLILYPAKFSIHIQR